MTASFARVRDLLDVRVAVEPAPAARTTTVFTPVGDSIEVPLLEIWCPRCVTTWECPRGMDPDLDRNADRGTAVAECPSCVDALADMRLADLPWEAE